MPILIANGKVLRSAQQIQAADAQRGIDTRTGIVERLLGKRIEQTGKNDLVAMIVAQYAAIERLISVVAELNPEHPLIKGFRSTEPEQKPDSVQEELFPGESE